MARSAQSRVNATLSAFILQPNTNLGIGMPAQRKVFRIEESAHADVRGAISATAPDDESALRHHELMTEVIALRALLSPRTPTSRKAFEPGREQIVVAHELKNELDLIYEAIRRTKQEMDRHDANVVIGPQMARVGRELGAVVAGTEQATENILKSAEDIDQIATNLSSLLKGNYEQGLAQDMRDHVVRIFEACNFQDLIGQRISTVVATLKFIEEHILRMLEIWHSIEQSGAPAPAMQSSGNRDGKSGLLNGPKLAGDPGHSSQAEIDVIFDSN
jgi:chemotaxis protein CheZ